MSIAAVDRQYISQWANDILGMVLHVQGVPQNADGAVQVTFINEATGDTVFVRIAENVSPGNYEVQLSGDNTATPGNYAVRWNYSVNGVPDEYYTFVIVGQSNPAYDRLSPEMKTIVDNVWLRFADAFDSPDGGPNLQSYLESHFTRGRIADILRIAVGRLNTAAQPYQTYSIDGQGGAEFPVTAWGSLLEHACYVESIKHLRRSYVEQPMFQGGGVTRLDRRDYLDRWGLILKDEEDLLKHEMDTFKIAQMNLGRGRTLVSGGVYGRWGPVRLGGGMGAPRGYYTNRFF